MIDADDRDDDADDASTPARPSIGGRAAAFAASIAGRARRLGERRAPISRVWRRSARAPLHRAATVGVTFAPVVHITIAAGRAADSPARREKRVLDSFVPPVARALLATSTPESRWLGVSAPTTATTVQRLIARRAGADGSLPSAPAHATLLGLAGELSLDRRSQRVAHPVTRVLRARSVASAAERVEESAQKSSPRSIATIAAPMLSTSEVNRVTEHVLRTMDRRISAFRERQGRS